MVSQNAIQFSKGKTLSELVLREIGCCYLCVLICEFAAVNAKPGPSGIGSRSAPTLSLVFPVKDAALPLPILSPHAVLKAHEPAEGLHFFWRPCSYLFVGEHAVGIEPCA